MQLSQSQKIWIVVILAAIASLIFFKGLAVLAIIILGILYLMYKGVKNWFANLGNPQAGKAAQGRYKKRAAQHPYPKSPHRIMKAYYRKRGRAF